MKDIELYYDDCFEIMKKLIVDGRKVDAIICDPPYLINYADWDREFNMPLAIDLCYEIIKENGNIILFQGWSNVAKTKNCLTKNSRYKTGSSGTALKGVEQKRTWCLPEKIFYGIARETIQHIRRFIPIFPKRPEDWERKTGSQTVH